VLSTEPLASGLRKKCGQIIALLEGTKLVDVCQKYQETPLQVPRILVPCNINARLFNGSM
jgi:hypothetical protein